MTARFFFDNDVVATVPITSQWDKRFQGHGKSNSKIQMIGYALLHPTRVRLCYYGEHYQLGQIVWALLIRIFILLVISASSFPSIVAKDLKHSHHTPCVTSNRPAGIPGCNSEWICIQRTFASRATHHKAQKRVLFKTKRGKDSKSP